MKQPYQLTELDVKRIRKLRADCQACGGNPQVCQEGTSSFDKLPGCRVFADDGSVLPLRKPASQPWELKKAA